MAEALGCHPLELVWTSGGSESNNLALQGFAKMALGKNPERKKIFLGAIEHPSILKQKEHLEHLGFNVIPIPVSRQGEYNLEFYKKNLDEKTALVSVMLANNELGIIAPVEKMVALAHEVGAYFHSDCVQALGKMEFHLKSLDVDMASFSSHKVYALKGAGLLYIKKGTPMGPLIYGGSQERRRRAGTENLLSIASFAYMMNHLNPQNFTKKVEPMKEYLEKELKKRIPKLNILAQGVDRLANTTSFFVPGLSAETLVMNLDMRGFFIGNWICLQFGQPRTQPCSPSHGHGKKRGPVHFKTKSGTGYNMGTYRFFFKPLCASG